VTEGSWWGAICDGEADLLVYQILVQEVMILSSVGEGFGPYL
jgi:hypothetical protein